MAYEIDSAMTGDLNPSRDELVTLARLLTDAGYPSRAITDLYNGATSDQMEDDEPPMSVWLAALQQILDRRSETSEEV
jgi:hypothetical protein